VLTTHASFFVIHVLRLPYISIGIRCRFSRQPVYIDRPVQTQQLALPPVLKPTLKFMTVADLDAIEDPFEFEVWHRHILIHLITRRHSYRYNNNHTYSS